MGKHTDQLGKIEDYRAPWENDAGETEIDKAVLKRYIFGLVTDKAKAQDARDESLEKVTEAEKNLADAKADVAKGDPTGKIAELEKKLADAVSKSTKTQGDLDRVLVAVDKKLTPEQAEFISGSTKAELEASADKLLKTFGVQPATKDPDDEGEDDDNEVRQSPRFSTLVNPLDRKSSGSDAVDFEKSADLILARRF